MPFKSKSQQRFMFATNPTMAREFAAHTDFSKLPERAKKPKKGAKATKKAQDLSRLELIPLVLKLAGAQEQGPVNYGPAPMPNASCGACKNFAGGGCAKYEIAVDPSYTCDAFEPAVTSVTIDAPPPMDPLMASGSTLDLAAASPGTGTGIAGNSVKLGTALGKAAAALPKITIDRPKGFKKTFHTPQGPVEKEYPLDYGFFEGVVNPQDNEGADVFVGTGGDKGLHGRFMKGNNLEGAWKPDEHKWYTGLTAPEHQALMAWWAEQSKDLVRDDTRFDSPDSLASDLSLLRGQQEKTAMNDWYANGGADYYCPTCRSSFDGDPVCKGCGDDCSKHNKTRTKRAAHSLTPSPALPSVINGLPGRRGNAAPPVPPKNNTTGAATISTPAAPQASRSIQQGYVQGLMTRNALPKSPSGVPVLRPKAAAHHTGQAMAPHTLLDALFPGTEGEKVAHAHAPLNTGGDGGRTTQGESRFPGHSLPGLTKLARDGQARTFGQASYSVAPLACGFLTRCEELGLSEGETLELVKVAAVTDFAVARDFARLAEHLVKEAGPFDAVARGTARGAVGSADDVARGATAGAAQTAGAAAKAVAPAAGQVTRMSPRVTPPAPKPAAPAPAAPAPAAPAAPAVAPPKSPAPALDAQTRAQAIDILAQRNARVGAQGAPKPAPAQPAAQPAAAAKPAPAQPAAQPTAPVAPKPAAQPAAQPTAPVTPQTTIPVTNPAAAGATTTALPAAAATATQASTGLATRVGNAGRALEGVSPAAYAARQLGRLGDTRLGRPVAGLLDNKVGRGMNAVARNVVTKPADYLFNLATGKGSLQNALQGKFTGLGAMKYNAPAVMLPMAGQIARGEKVTTTPNMGQIMLAPLQAPIQGARYLHGALPESMQADPTSLTGQLLKPKEERFSDYGAGVAANVKDLGSLGSAATSVFDSGIRGQQARNALENVPRVPGMIARKSVDDLGGSTIDKQVKDLDEQLLKLPPGDPARAALEEKRKAIAVDPDYEHNLKQWQAVKDKVDPVLANPGAYTPEEVRRAEIWQNSAAGQKPLNKYNPELPPQDTGAQLGAAAAGSPTPEQQGLNALEQNMQEAWLDSQDARFNPQAQQEARQKFEQLRAQHKQLAGQAGTQTQLKPLSPEEAKANDATIQQANARLTELHTKAQSGQALTPEETAEFQQQQQALAQGAFRSAYSAVAQQTGMNPQQFQQGLQGNDPNNPVTQMGVQQAQSALQQQSPQQPVDAGQAHGFWSGLEGWQKGMLLAGMGMGLFGLMAGFMGGEGGGMMAPLLGGLGMLAGGMGLAKGKPSNLLDANYLRDLFSGTKPGDIPEMPTAASLGGAAAGGGAPTVKPQAGGPVPPPATPPATPPAPGRPSTPAGPTAAPTQPTAPAAPVPQVRMPRGANMVVPNLARDVQKPEVARGLQPFMGPNGELDTNKMLGATPQQLGPVWQNLSPEARTEVWNEANRTKDPQQRARAVATVKGLIANTR